MARALELAGAAQEWGAPPIGAVVLAPDGAVLAEAANEREKRGDPTAHAEVLALRAAAQAHGDGWRLWGAGAPPGRPGAGGGGGGPPPARPPAPRAGGARAGPPPRPPPGWPRP